MGESGIYYIKNTKDKMIYIGQSKNIKSRFREHRWRLRAKRHTNNHLQNSWNLNNEESFKFGIFELCSEENLDEKETFYIKKYKSNQRGKGYNLDTGGSVNRNISDETKEKVSLANKGKIFSEETRKKISIAKTGIRMSEATKNKLRIINTGKKVSKETKEKISKANSRPRGKYPQWRIDKVAEALRKIPGHPQTEKTKRKISIANKGKSRGVGRKHSEETKQKMRKNHNSKK